jgi:energy-converting hydrogenase Eha subunit H
MGSIVATWLLVFGIVVLLGGMAFFFYYLLCGIVKQNMDRREKIRAENKKAIVEKQRDKIKTLNLSLKQIAMVGAMVIPTVILYAMIRKHKK